MVHGHNMVQWVKTTDLHFKTDSESVIFTDGPCYVHGHNIVTLRPLRLTSSVVASLLSILSLSPVSLRPSLFSLPPLLSHPIVYILKYHKISEKIIKHYKTSNNIKYHQII